MKLSLFELCITRPLGFLIQFIYNFVENYGLAIILFTIVIKLILMPLQIRSQKAMKRQQKVQPIIMELQKKYANDQQRLQQEMMKVYKENNVSMTGGCLPLLLQFPILIGLYRVIQRPLTYIKGISLADSTFMENIKEVVSKMGDKIGNLANMTPEQLAQNSQIQLSTWAEQLGVSEKFGWDVNFKFLGLDLSETPAFGSVFKLMNGDFSDLSTTLLILIPAFAMLMTWLSSKYSQKLSGTANAKNTNEQAQSMTKSMNVMMPLMTGFFTFSLPSGIGIYWIISSVMQIVQQFIITKFFEGKEDDFVVKVPDKNRKRSKKHR